jgi:Tol biopolymer transport system component
LHSKEEKEVMATHGNGLYASGHLLFLRGNTLMAQPFDLKKLELNGDAVPIADPVQEDITTLNSMMSVSEEGTMLFLEGATTAGRQLLWVDRKGKKVDEVPGLDSYRSPRISPDGLKVSYTLSNSGFEVWDYDRERKIKSKLTFAGAGQGNLDAIWSPDGKKIAYTSIQNGEYAFHIKAADGSGNDEELLARSNKTKNLTDWSKDGKFILFQEVQQELFYLPVQGDHKPVRFQPANFNETVGMFSPDGRWIAYCSTESGEQRVYVVSFLESGGKWQVSSAAGCMPRWRNDGKEIFYLSADSKIMSVEVKANGTSFVPGAVKPLFETRIYRALNGGFDVTGDGQNFVLAYEIGQPDAVITLVENWDAELKKK